MSDIVTLTHRNVCKNGFTVTDSVDSGTPLSFVTLHSAQSVFPSVFLDLPAPWEAVEYAKSALRVRPTSHISPATLSIQLVDFLRTIV